MAKEVRRDPKNIFDPIDPGIIEALNALAELAENLKKKDVKDLKELTHILTTLLEGHHMRQHQKQGFWAAFVVFVGSLLFTFAILLLEGFEKTNLPTTLHWGLIVLTVGQTGTLVAVALRFFFGGELAIPSFRGLSLPKGSNKSKENEEE